MVLKRDWRKFSQKSFDVLVIGGGINGAAIAHMAALNGLKAALLEKGDFASGTSSKSTKLIHGGLRYLENFEFGLVRESLRERYVQLKSAPHLVHPLKFIIPVYSTDRRPLWMVKLGVGMYDFLSGKYVIEKHRVLTVEEVVRRVPGIRTEGLRGGVEYSDAQMNDARLCLENILSAVSLGAVVTNYAEVCSLVQENGKVVGALARDSFTGDSFEVRAAKVVCAIGPWANMFISKELKPFALRVRTTKGVHLVLKGEIAREGILVPTQKDGRVFFILPWGTNSLIGTTDTDFTGSPDEVAVDDSDRTYLMEETMRLLPQEDLSHEKIITAFSGLRPLVHEEGKPSKVSRKHVIKISDSGLIYVLGGKYTTYRKIAEDVVSKLTAKPLVDTRNDFPVYGSGWIEENAHLIAQHCGLNPEVVQSLMDFYGIRYNDVLQLIDEDARLKKTICSCCDILRAQVVYAVKKEMACTAADIIERRLMLNFIECPTGNCRKEIEKIVAASGRELSEG